MFDRPKSPLVATINVTGNCNLNCNYCFFVPRENIDMPVDDFKYVIQALKQEEVFLVVLSGGEPFVHPSIDDLIEIAHENFYHVQILSNGTSITRKNIDTIKKIIDRKGFFPIQISLDSHNTITNQKTRGESGTILDNICKLTEIGANVTVSTVITRHNIKSIPETILNLSSITRSFHIMPFKRQKFNEMTEDIEADHEEMEKLWGILDNLRRENCLNIKIPSADFDDSYCADGAPCMAGFSHIVIDPSLKVRACDRCTTNFVGDLKKNSLTEIWNGKELEGFYNIEQPFCTL